MASDHASRCQEVVRQEDKEARLDQFLGFYLDRLFADWEDQPGQHHITIVARSPASPVARALMVNADDIRQGGIHVRILFSELEPSEALSDWYDLVLNIEDISTATTIDIRCTTNPALVDAHEQLVLGEEMSWSGDAMRRDPRIRDTIEIFDPCCPMTAQRNTRSFDALWSKGRKIKIDRKRRKQDTAGHQDSAIETVGLGGCKEHVHRKGATVSTRH